VGSQGELLSDDLKEFVMEYPMRKCAALEELLEDSAARCRACAIGIAKRPSGRAPEFLRKEVAALKKRMREHLLVRDKLASFAEGRIAALTLEDVLGTSTRVMANMLQRDAHGAVCEPAEPTLYAKRKLVAWAHGVIGCKEEHRQILEDMESTLRQYRWEVENLEKHAASLSIAPPCPEWREHVGDKALVARKVHDLRIERANAVRLFQQALQGADTIGTDGGTFLWMTELHIESECESEGQSSNSDLVEESDDDGDNDDTVEFEIGRGFSYE
jgi:hypothetical protein